MVRVRVWDLPLRCFHWALLVLVCLSAGSGLLGEKLGTGVTEWHARCGYAILSLLLFRIAWGFCGGSQARFAAFVRGPRAVADYLRRALRGEPQPALGHNPAGGWSVLAMLASLLAQAASGLFLADEDLGFAAPLAKHVSSGAIDALKAAHQANAVVLALLVALHLAAIAFYLFVKQENLIRPMIDGDKLVATAAPPAGGHPLLGAAVFALAAAAVAALVLLA